MSKGCPAGCGTTSASSCPSVNSTRLPADVPAVPAACSRAMRASVPSSSQVPSGNTSAAELPGPTVSNPCPSGTVAPVLAAVRPGPAPLSRYTSPCTFSSRATLAAGAGDCRNQTKTSSTAANDAAIPTAQATGLVRRRGRAAGPDGIVVLSSAIASAPDFCATFSNAHRSFSVSSRRNGSACSSNSMRSCRNSSAASCRQAAHCSTCAVRSAASAAFNPSSS